MTPDEQDKFAEFLRDHLSSSPQHYTLSFKGYAAQVLGREVDHWRTLSRQDARKVMSAAAKLKPKTEAA